VLLGTPTSHSSHPAGHQLKRAAPCFVCLQREQRLAAQMRTQPDQPPSHHPLPLPSRTATATPLPAASLGPHLVCEWELDLAVVELLSVVTLAGGSRHGGSLDDLQGQSQTAEANSTTGTGAGASKHKTSTRHHQSEAHASCRPACDYALAAAAAVLQMHLPSHSRLLLLMQQLPPAAVACGHLSAQLPEGAVRV
jgi:hypothetical protein